MDDQNRTTSPSPTPSTRNGPEELGPFASMMPFEEPPGKRPEQFDSHPAYRHMFSQENLDRVGRIFLRGCCLADLAGTIRFSVCEGHINVAITKGFASMVVAKALDDLITDENVVVETTAI